MTGCDEQTAPLPPRTPGQDSGPDCRDGNRGDDHDFGPPASGGSQVAVYATSLEVTARSAVASHIPTDPETGIPIPPVDPHDPDPTPELPLEVDIEVTATADDATP